MPKLKSTKSTTRKTVKSFLSSKYFLDCVFNEDEIKYIEYVLWWFKENQFIPPNSLYSLISKQIKNYEDSDSYYEGFHNWLKEKSWNAMSEESWIIRYGEREGKRRFNERILKCNSFLNKTEEEIALIKDKISKSGKKVYQERGENYKKEKMMIYPEFWVKHRGCTLQEAKEKVKEHHSWLFKNRKPMVRSKSNTNTCVEFYIAKGMSKDDAAEALKQRQSTKGIRKLWNAYKYYRKKVDKISNEWCDKGFVGDIDKRGKEYHLDHIYSVFDGFWNKVPEDVVGHWKNLRIIPALENKEKWARSDILLEDLLEEIENERIC